MSFFREDEEALERFRRGDSDVLARVYRFYLPEVARVLRMGFRLTTPDGVVLVPGMRSVFDVENGCHEAFLRAFSESARRSYDGVRPYSNYLFRIARNWAIDRYRVSHRDVLVATVPDQAVEPAAIEAQLSAELSGLLATFVAGLPVGDRRYYEARYRKGLNQTDAAGLQGLTRIQGRRIEARMKRDLRAFLASRGYGGES